MGASFLITLREGLEIALVLAILIAYLHRTGRSSRINEVWLGSAVAAVVCVITGYAFYRFVGEFEGKAEYLIEGVLAFAAVAILTWMIFWMRGQARGITSELHRKIDDAIDGSTFALAGVAFVAVAREGFETVLFLISAETASASGTSVVIGGLIGLAVSAVIGYLFYLGSDRVDLKAFFNITGLLLILFAAGLFAKGVHEMRLYFDLDGEWYSTPVWDITSGPLHEGWTYDFLKGLFGWSDHPERIRVLAYFAYLVPTLWFYFRGRVTPAAAESADERQDVTV